MLSSSIQRLHTEFQPNWLKNAKVKHVFHFQAGRLVGWQAGLAGQHAKIFINQIHMLSPSIQRLHTKFQPNRLKNAKVMQVFHFQAGRLVGWQAGLVSQHAKILTNQIHMLSPSIQRLHTKFQPNWLKNAEVMHVFHFQAGKLVGWQAGLAGQHAKIFTIQIHMLSPSIQRLHTKFQPNWLKNTKVMHVFHFQASRLVGWQAGLASQHAKIFINQIHMLSPYIQRLHTKFQPNWLKNSKLIHVFFILGWQAGWVVGWFAGLLKNPFFLKKSIWINPFWINPDKIVDFFNRWIFSKMRHTM